MYTSPPSTAITSASLRCRMIETTFSQGQTAQEWSPGVVSYFHLRVSYHDHFQARINCGGRLAFNVGDITHHAVDAPGVTLGCFRSAHGAPFNCVGWWGWRDVCGVITVRLNLWFNKCVIFVCVLFFCFWCTAPFLRERMLLMYSAPRYRKESVFRGSCTSFTVESLNIRFLAGS